MAAGETTAEAHSGVRFGIGLSNDGLESEGQPVFRGGGRRVLCFACVCLSYRAEREKPRSSELEGGP